MYFVEHRLFAVCRVSGEEGEEEEEGVGEEGEGEGGEEEEEEEEEEEGQMKIYNLAVHISD